MADMNDTIQLAHGSGGRLTRELIRSVLLDAGLASEARIDRDSVVLNVPADHRIAVSTDSFVITPHVFPGGDIGKLAVCGTANDLLMSGAVPRQLTVALILEQGLPIGQLREHMQSLHATAKAAGVTVVAGDTKVVEHGQCDGLYITTTGVGMVRAGRDIGPGQIQAGDAIVVSGDLGRHGVAIMAARESLGIDGLPGSDCMVLNEPVGRLLDDSAGLGVHCMRDLTRGGLASALNELALDTGCDMSLDESAIPVDPAVAAACELLGLDPLYVANEGRFAVLLPADQAARGVDELRQCDGCERAAIIGTVTGPGKGHVTATGGFGMDRPIDLLAGEQLPRIC